MNHHLVCVSGTMFIYTNNPPPKKNKKPAPRRAPRRRRAPLPPAGVRRRPHHRHGLPGAAQRGVCHGGTEGHSEGAELYHCGCWLVMWSRTLSLALAGWLAG